VVSLMSRFAPLIVRGPAATYVVSFDTGGGHSAVLWQWADGTLTKLADRVDASPLITRAPLLLSYRGHPYIHFPGALFGAPEGVWRRQVFPGTTGEYGTVRGSPDGNALCLTDPGVDHQPDRGLIVDGPLQSPALGEKLTDCWWSPAGDEVAFTSTAKPDSSIIMDRAGTRTREVAHTLLPDSQFDKNGQAYSLAVDHHHRRLLSVEWSSGLARPIVEVDALGPALAADPDCRFSTASTEGQMPSLAVVKVLCGCPDCDDGASFGLDVVSSRIHLIEGPYFHAVYARAFVSGGVVTASVPADSQGYALEPRTLLFTDPGGTRPFDAVGAVSVPRNPVAVPELR
jgi:hypothetical protein